jgi:hypothetical protein
LLRGFPASSVTDVAGIQRACLGGLRAAPAARPRPGPPGFCVWGRQAARRWTSQMVAATSRIASRSSPPPSMPWNGQYRLAGW